MMILTSTNPERQIDYSKNLSKGDSTKNGGQQETKDNLMRKCLLCAFNVS